MMPHQVLVVRLTPLGVPIVGAAGATPFSVQLMFPPDAGLYIKATVPTNAGTWMAGPQSLAALFALYLPAPTRSVESRGSSLPTKEMEAKGLFVPLWSTRLVPERKLYQLVPYAPTVPSVN